MLNVYFIFLDFCFSALTLLGNKINKQHMAFKNLDKAIPNEPLLSSLTHCDRRKKTTANCVCIKNCMTEKGIVFSLVLRHCWLGDRKGIQPVKSWVLVYVDGDDFTGALRVL